MSLFKESDAGCWFDSARGIYIGEAVIELAMGHGFNPEAEELEGGWKEHEYYLEIWSDAEDFLCGLAPEGYWIGSSEGGDFGMWHSE